jgi:hypothetical protein
MYSGRTSSASSNSRVSMEMVAGFAWRLVMCVFRRLRVVFCAMFGTLSRERNEDIPVWQRLMKYSKSDAILLFVERHLGRKVDFTPADYRQWRTHVTYTFTAPRRTHSSRRSQEWKRIARLCFIDYTRYATNHLTYPQHDESRKCKHKTFLVDSGSCRS